MTTEGLEHFKNVLKKHLDDTNWTTTTIDTLDNNVISINNKISPLENNIEMLKNRVTALEYELFEKEGKEQKIYKPKKRISVHIKL